MRRRDRIIAEAKQQALAEAKAYIDLKNPGASLVLGPNESRLKDEFSQLPIVYAVINAIAKRVARVPLRFYRPGTDNEIDNNPVIERLRKPTFTSGFSLWLQTWVINKETQGQAMFRMDREKIRGVPVSLWPVREGDFRPKIDNGIFLGWEFKTGQRWSFYETSEVIFDRYVHPSKHFEGLSPLEAARTANETEFEARRFNKKFFENDATPGHHWNFPDGMNDAQMSRWRHELEEKRRGTENAHGLVITTGSVNHETIGISQRDAQFIEQMGLTLHDVCAVFGVDPAIIGFEKESKYASAKEARRYFWSDVIVPYLTTISGTLTEQFTRNFGVECRFDLSGIEALQANMVERSTVAKVFYDMGVPFNIINERLDLGFPEIAGGDEPKPMGSPMLFHAPEEEAEEKSYSDLQDTLNEVRKLHRVEKWKGITRGVRDLTSKLNRKLKTYFFEVKKKLEVEIDKHLSDYVQKVTRPDMGAIDDAVNLEKLVRLVTGFLTDAGVIGWSQILGRDFSEPPQAVLDMVAGRATMVRNIGENARKEIRNIVGEAIDSGLSEADTRELLMERLDHSISNLQSRATAIARTEVHTAHSIARHDAMEETGPVGKRWIAAIDARESHAECEGQGVIKWDEPFANGLQFPHEPGGPAEEVINCRCILEPIYAGEEDAP